jgi:hypothetical protein
LAPDSVAVPAPLLATPPPPARTALTVPADRAKVPDDDRIPFWIVPPVSVMPPFCVCVVAPRSSVPPATVVAPAALPSVPLPESCSVPAFTVVPPP